MAIAANTISKGYRRQPTPLKQSLLIIRIAGPQKNPTRVAITMTITVVRRSRAKKRGNKMIIKKA